MKKIIITIGIAVLVATSILAQSGNVYVANGADHPVPVTAAAALPVGSTAVTNASGNKANASAAATLAAVSGKTNYITGFACTASGATAGLPVNVTVAGVLGGTLTYTFTYPAGVLVPATPLVINFIPPIPASATNTAITVTLPASGAGGTNAAAVAQGFVL